ncbi:MAG: nicotinate-nucleotide--dimethylbenzimidazole phosphoribosyltransferase [Elusimicrobia bacterium]|nr:nicotinate-nucleotide--dimethylbenzimidazole phosphoribosyltransferase [Elusimicrobiota bacterium]
MNLPKINALDKSLEALIKKRLDSLTKPVGSLGMLEEIAQKMALIKNSLKPAVEKKRVYVFASDHGIAEEGVSAYPQDVTKEMVKNFISGGAAINVFSKHTNTEVIVVDAGVKTDIKARSEKFIVRKLARSTKNFAHEPAMTRDEAEKCIQTGVELAENAARDGVDIIVIGDMGIGNTTVAAAISVAGGIEIDKVIDIGTVIDSLTLKRKKRVIENAVRLHSPDPKDPIDILSKVGGYCIGQMTGLILKAASIGIPVVLDGFPVTSAALLAYKLEPKVKDYLFAGHLSAVRGHKTLLDYLGLEPILRLDMRLGEGTGGVLALSIIEAAVKMMNEMATFEDAGVSKGKEDVKIQ